MSIPSKSFHSPHLNSQTKGREEYYKNIIFIPFHSIPSSQVKPKYGLIIYDISWFKTNFDI